MEPPARRARLRRMVARNVGRSPANSTQRACASPLAACRTRCGRATRALRVDQKSSGVRCNARTVDPKGSTVPHDGTVRRAATLQLALHWSLRTMPFTRA
jgi:hypothetical protein